MIANMIATLCCMSPYLCNQQIWSWAAVADSPAAAVVAVAPHAADSLEALCADKFGRLCVDQIIDPACPALTRVDNKWRITNTSALLCQTGCLRALCTLQEGAKAETSGADNGTAHSIN